jgi:hypothetical protein
VHATMPDSRARGLGASINYTKEEPAATKIQSDKEADEHIHEVLNMGFTGGTIVKLKSHIIKPDGL